MDTNASIEALRLIAAQINKSLEKLKGENSLAPGGIIKLETESIQKIVRETRKSMKVTQGELSDLSGIALGTVQKIEKGDLHVNLQNFMRIMEVMGIELCLRKK